MIDLCYEDEHWAKTIDNPCPHAPIYVAEIAACYDGLLEVQLRIIIGEEYDWFIETDNIIALAFFQKTRGRIKFALNQLLCKISVFTIIMKKLAQIDLVYVPSAESKADVWSRPN